MPCTLVHPGRWRERRTAACMHRRNTLDVGTGGASSLLCAASLPPLVLPRCRGSHASLSYSSGRHDLRPCPYRHAVRRRVEVRSIPPPCAPSPHPSPTPACSKGSPPPMRSEGAVRDPRGASGAKSTPALPANDESPARDAGCRRRSACARRPCVQGRPRLTNAPAAAEGVRAPPGAARPPWHALACTA
jgi:hypothetical protein